MLAKLSLKAKILALCFAISIPCVVLGVSDAYFSKKIKRASDRIAKVNLPGAITLSNLRDSFRSLGSLVRKNALEAGNPLTYSNDEAKKDLEELDAALATYNKAADKYMETDFLPGELDLLRPLL